MGCFIHFFKINIGFSQIDRIHAAADVHAYHVRNGFPVNRHGGADGAAFSRMHIRHNTDLGTLRHGVIAHPSDLLYGFLLHYLCVAERCIHLSFNLYHRILLPARLCPV